MRLPRGRIGSDDTHRLLGYGMASSLADGALIRDGDTLAVGGGRGVYHMCEAQREARYLRARNIMIVSLCGDIYPHHELGPSNFRLDADTNVNLLGSAFEEKVDLRMVSHPIGTADPELPKKKSQYFFGKDWDQRTPNHAFAGVGVVTGIHRLAVLAGKQNHHVMSVELHARLETLGTLCQRYSRNIGELEPYFPVAEVAHNLFFVPDRTGRTTISKSDRSEFEDLITAINENLFSPSLADLGRMEALILIAGTALKAGAIRHLLTAIKSDGSNIYPLRFICTDHETAELVLKH